MKQVAYMVLGIVVLAHMIQPLTEIMEVCREQVMISAAINNSFRAARDRSLTEESIRDLDAEVDENYFVQYFIEAFEDTLDVYATSQNTSYITFESNTDKYYTITAEIDMYETDVDEKQATQVTVHVETPYRFKMGLLKKYQETGSYGDYNLKFTREYLLYVKN